MKNDTWIIDLKKKNWINSWMREDISSLDFLKSKVIYKHDRSVLLINRSGNLSLWIINSSFADKSQFG